MTLEQLKERVDEVFEDYAEGKLTAFEFTTLLQEFIGEWRREHAQE